MKNRTLLLAIFLFSLCIGRAQENSFSEAALSDTFINHDGDKVSFESIIKKNQGSVVLLDIWASWCKDCIVGMPTVKQLTKAYPDVKFVYISLDKDEKKWKDGMEKYDFKSGQHYWAPKGWKSDLFASVDLDWIPRYMVLDETGKIKLFRAIKADDKNIVKQIN